MQEGQQRFTLTRSRDDKWMVHIDGTRKAGMKTADVLALLQELLAEPDRLASVMIETKRAETAGR
jgi:hypothetical protein